MFDLKKTIDSISVLNFKTIFLLNAIGALLTATLLIVVGVFDEYFGMPQDIILLLSVTALFFAVISFLAIIHPNYCLLL